MWLIFETKMVFAATYGYVLDFTIIHSLWMFSYIHVIRTSLCAVDLFEVKNLKIVYMKTGL